MTLLTVVRGACAGMGINMPSTVAGNSSLDVAQLLELVNDVGYDLATDLGWQGVTQEATFTTVAAEVQGDIATLAPGYNRMLSETAWNRSLRWRLIGPINPGQSQALKAMVTAGPRYSFRLRGGKLIMQPAPPAGQQIAFEYISRNWVRSADGATARAAYQADDDVAVLDETIIKLGLKWKWRAAKGFDYSQEKDDYDMAALKAQMGDGGAAVLDMSGPMDEYRPADAVWIPQVIT